MSLSLDLVNGITFTIFSLALLVMTNFVVVRPLRGIKGKKSEYRKFREQNSSDGWLKFIWRKKYKQALWLVGAIGSWSIVFADNLVKGLDINANDELTATLLFITALIVFWYTRETYDLKRIAEKEVRVARQTQMNEFMPIIYPLSGILQGDQLNLELGNDGKGLAKRIRVNLGSVTVVEGRSIKGKDRADVHGEKHLANIAMQTNNQSVNEIPLEIIYEDIYKRTFRTVGCSFVRDEPGPQNRFRLQKEEWEFRES
jgi:hypothetical protein